MHKSVRHKHKKEISHYLEKDCVYLYELVDGFIQRYGAKLTMASVAMAELKKSIENKDRGRVIQRMNKWQDERFRNYYYGGRCECRQYGRLDSDWLIYDINSAYPYAMTHKHPDPLWCSFYCDTKFPKKHDVFFATIKAISKGALPYRDPDKNYKLCFPTDNVIREYNVTGYEIRAGIDTGTLQIKEILEVWIPDRIRDFKDFVLPRYDERMAAKSSGDKLMELYIKLILNSAYGKFALNPDEFRKYKVVQLGEYPVDLSLPENQNSDGFDDWIKEETFPDAGIDIYWRPDPQERGYYNVAVAASITGFVRAYLWRAICASKNVIYCDTDAIICNGTDIENSTELGGWKLEGEGKIAYLAGKKLYAIYTGKNKRNIFDGEKYKDKDHLKFLEWMKDNWKMASKGARLLPSEIKRIAADGETIEWLNEAPTFSLKYGTRFLKRKIKTVK
jgi:hypothetical protein